MNDHPHAGHGHPRWSGLHAVVYSMAHLAPPSNRLMVDIARLRPDDRALDVGCGTGAAVIAAARLVTEGTVRGVDPSAALLRVARLRRLWSRGRRRIEFARGTADRLPLPDGSVTVAWTINSLHHWEDPAADLGELHRVLVPGGRLLVAEDESVHAPGSGKEHRGRHVTAEQVAAWVDGAGFTGIVTERGVLGDLAVVSSRRPA